MWFNERRSVWRSEGGVGLFHAVVAAVGLLVAVAFVAVVVVFAVVVLG